MQNKLAMMLKMRAQMFRECGVPIPHPMIQTCDHLEVVKEMNKEHLLNSGPTKFMSRNLFQLFAASMNQSAVAANIEFEEEQIPTYDKQILVSFADLQKPRPYSSEY